MLLLKTYVFPPVMEASKRPFLLSIVKTGDLIFMGGKTNTEKMLRTVSCCPFSHVGIIVVVNSIPYILEADVGQGYNSGSRVIPLQDKIDRWRGEKGVAIRKLIDGIDKEIFVTAAINAITNHRGMDAHFISYVLNKRFQSGPLWYVTGEGVFCSEMVAEILGDFPHEWICPTEVDPGWLLRDEKIPYGEPLYFDL